MANFPKKKGKMIQMSSGGNIESVLKGGERIYSRVDTETIIKMAKSAKTDQEIKNLGKFVYEATKKQDLTPPEFTED